MTRIFDNQRTAPFPMYQGENTGGTSLVSAANSWSNVMLGAASKNPQPGLDWPGHGDKAGGGFASQAEAEPN